MTRPKKILLGNLLLVASFSIVALVALQNFRVLKSVKEDTVNTGVKMRGKLPIITTQQQQQQQQQDTQSLILSKESIHTFVVWTYPSSPDFTEEPSLKQDDLFLCSYPPCGTLESQRLNLRALTTNTTFQDFISNHALYKVSQLKVYLHHVQSVALLSLIRKYPSKCAKTWGDDTSIFCGSDLKKYARYNPEKSLKPAFDVKKVPTFKEGHFNVLTYDSKIKMLKEANMEDELQSLASAQFYPYVTNFVDRDAGLTRVTGHLLANARFRSMFQTPSSLTDIWDTTFASIQLRYDAKTTVQSHLWLFKGYNDKAGAIGAEDVATLDFLQQEEIKSYLASSFTLMLERNMSPRRNATVIIDVKPGLLPPAVEKNAIHLQRTMNEPNRLRRITYANKILSTFANEAKVVITSRIQMALPAMAMGIPVIYVGMKDYLEGNGVGDMFHVFDPYNGDTWTFDLENLPPTRPGVHQADRARASFWNVLKRESPFYSNTAHLYGMVPLERLGLKVPDGEVLHTLFHFIFTTPPETLTWREKRAIEHVFYFHPNAKVILHSNTLEQGDCELDIFGEVGYDFTIQPYDLADMLQKTVSDKKLVKSFVSNLDDFSKGEHWYSHETDILRYMLLWHSTGVYLDTDMYLIKPLSRQMTNVLAYQDARHEYVSGALMIFERRHPLMQAALTWTLENYAARRNEWPVLGSTLMTLLHKKEKDKDGTFRVLDDATFYPIDWESIDKCFKEELPSLDLSETYGVHLNTKITSHYTFTTKGTFCDKLLHAYCIFCDEIHTTKRLVESNGVRDEQQDAGFADFAGDGFAGFAEDMDHSLFANENPAAKPEGGSSFFSRLMSGLFGRETKKPESKTIPVDKRKVLPPVHMEFVKKGG